MAYLTFYNSKKFAFNLNTKGMENPYPEYEYITENGGLKKFTHIVPSRLMSLGLPKCFSDAGYKYKPIYSVTPEYIEKHIKGKPDPIQVLNPRYLDIINYHFTDKVPVVVDEFRGKVKPTINKDPKEKNNKKKGKRKRRREWISERCQEKKKTFEIN
jgi:hypothetical protein